MLAVITSCEKMASFLTVKDSIVLSLYWQKKARLLPRFGRFWFCWWLAVTQAERPSPSAAPETFVKLKLKLKKNCQLIMRRMVAPRHIIVK